MIAPWYMMTYAKLERIAVRHGWCLTLHGSMSRDLDLVLIPWTDDAEPEEVVLEAIQKFVYGSRYWRKNKKQSKLHATKKPHGRKAYVITIGIEGQYLDISIMPRIKVVDDE